MSIFQRVIDRLADSIWIGRKVNLRFTAEYRTACFTAPLIAKLLAEDADGHAYRSAIVPWHRAEPCADSRRHGRFAPKLHGSALPEPLHRRTQLPRTL